MNVVMLLAYCWPNVEVVQLEQLGSHVDFGPAVCLAMWFYLFSSEHDILK
jgi:hypothetical protein